jgi:hypothetical protein
MYKNNNKNVKNVKEINGDSDHAYAWIFNI